MPIVLMLYWRISLFFLKRTIPAGIMCFLAWTTVLIANHRSLMEIEDGDNAEFLIEDGLGGLKQNIYEFITLPII